MNAKLAILILGLIAQVYGACINCGFGPGRDTCKGTRCAPMIVRPNKLPKIDISELCKPRVIVKHVGGYQPLKPVGDLCSCNKAIVTPAFIPRPACALCVKPCGCASSCCSSAGSYDGASSHSSGLAGYTSGSAGYHSGSSGYSADHDHHHHHHSDGHSGVYVSHSAAPSFEHVISTSGSSSGASSGSSSSTGSFYGINNCDDGSSAYDHAYKPADAVSLSLAYKLQHEMNNIAEDKLFFGFTKMPKEVQVVKKAKHTIAEENLYGHNGQVVELKHIMVGNGKSIDEEAAETLMDEELNEDVDCEAGHSGVAKLTYGQIGFGLAKVKEVPYECVHGEGVEPIVAAESCPKVCNDGYIPGKVMMHSAPQVESYVQKKCKPVSMYDDDYEDESGPISYPAFSYSSSHSSSAASSASNSHHHHQSGAVVFEKLGCHDD